MAGEVMATLEARDLQAIDNILYEAPKEELVARSILNVKTDVHPGAEFYGYNVLTRSGSAKIIANGADDIPMVDTDMTRHIVTIYSIATSFRVSIQEQRAAQLTNSPIDATKAETARRAISEKENNISFIGDKKFNIMGIANATGIQISNAAANGTGSSTKWSAKTSEQIIEDVRLAKKKITVLPGYGGAVLVLALPPDQYEELNRRYSDFDSRTIRKVLEENSWFASGIKRVADLTGVGTSSTDAMIIMDTAKSTAELLLPMDITRHKEEYKFPNTKVPLEERFGGVILRAPQAVIRVDGI